METSLQPLPDKPAVAPARVLLINMPFANLRWPTMGPSLLKAAIEHQGISCDVAYLNFDFAERVGLDRYHWIADFFAFVLGGERLFARHYFGDDLSDDATYFQDVLLAADPGLTAKDGMDFLAVGQHVEPFIEEAVDAFDWSRYAVVGFTASFQQTMASICLARRIRQKTPNTKIIFGGAACEGEMGIELAARFHEIDYVFLGEADGLIVPVIEQILAGQPVEPTPGVIGRQSIKHERPRPPDVDRFLVRDLDTLPYPDFDDYFARLESSRLKDRIDPLLFYETSRGCWWGQKHQCAFCGLNGGTLAFRSKTPGRVVDELRYLVERHDLHRACAADNIFDHRYFDTLLPLLEQADLDLRFVCELKCNLARRQVEALLAAGMGAVQLGIETFITPVLQRIGKGIDAIGNLQTLKWFSEPRIEVKWNLLYGFPEEDPADYAALAELLPSLFHLAPPLAVGRVRMDRFSPYFEDPAAWGMARPRPHRAFAHVYPFHEDSRRRLAYYYEYDYADGRDPLDYATEVLEAIETWQGLARSVTLSYYDRPDGVLILHDTRPCAVTFQRRLTGTSRAIYLGCDTGRSFDTVLKLARECSNGPADATGPPLSEEDVRSMLDLWVEERIMARLDDRYVSLALRAAPDDPSPNA